MKRVGALYCRVVDVTDGWIDVELKSGGTATVFLKKDISDSLRAGMESFKRNNTLLNIYCSKNKHGDFMFGGYKTFAAQTRAQKTKRIKAEADMRAMEAESSNTVRARSNRQKAAKHSLAAQKGTAKLPKAIRELVVGSIQDIKKIKVPESNFLP